MGVFDDADFWENLLKKAAENYQQQDSKAPLNSGLLAAGLGMLANAHRGTAGGIGAGGLMGLEAYNAERQRQQKDPAALLGLANGVMGLRQNMNNQALQKEVMGGFAGQAPLAPQFTPEPGSNLPQDTPQRVYGMFDRGTGDGGPLGSMATPPDTRMPPAMTMRLATAMGMSKGDPQMAELGRLFVNKLTELQKVGPGENVYSVNPLTNTATSIVQRANLDKNMREGADGSAEMVPGAADALARLTGAQTGAQEREKAALDVVQIPDGKGGQISMPRAQAIALLSRSAPQQPQAAQEPPPGVLAAMQFMQKQGQPVRWDAQTGLQMGDAAKNYQAPEAFGVQRTPEAAKLAEQQALMPGQISQAASQELNKTDATEFAAVRDTAKQAARTNQTISNIRELSTGKDAALSGMMAPTAQSALAFLNGIGLDVDKEKFQSTQEADTYLKGLSLAQVKTMVGSQNISDRDVAAVKAMMPQISNDPKVRLRLLDTLEKANNTSIDLFQRMDKHLAQSPTLRGFDYGFDKPAEKKAPDVTPDKTPMPGARQAPDGKWYIKSGNQYLRVEQ